MILYAYNKSKILSAIIIICLLITLYNLPAGYIDFVHITTMFPYFVIGLIFFKNQEIIFYHSKCILYFSLLIFIIFSFFWQSNEYNIYTHLFEWNISYFKLYLIRTIIGTSGSISIILFVKQIIEHRQKSRFVINFAKIGNATLGIYVFQYFIIARFINLYCIPYISNLNILHGTKSEYIFYDFILTPIISIIILFTCYSLVLLIRKNNITKLIFLGEK